MTESRIPTEKDPAKPQHWPYRMWLYAVRLWEPHHIEGCWLYPDGGCMVSANEEIATRQDWRRAVLAAWVRGDAVHFDAATEFSGLLRLSIRNGCWVFRSAGVTT